MESCSRAERITRAGPYSRTIAPVKGLEPPTSGSVDQRSVQLSYTGIARLPTGYELPVPDKAPVFASGSCNGQSAVAVGQAETSLIYRPPAFCRRYTSWLLPQLTRARLRTPDRNRTCTLLVRSQVLSPLSYRGMESRSHPRVCARPSGKPSPRRFIPNTSGPTVLPEGFEPPASSLSERCSNR